jgi:hypothetical protein
MDQREDEGVDRIYEGKIDEPKEESIIALANACSNPWTMVVKFQYTVVAELTMFRTGWAVNMAGATPLVNDRILNFDKSWVTRGLGFCLGYDSWIDDSGREERSHHTRIEHSRND